MVRFSSLAPRCVSRSETCRETAEVESPRRSAARELRARNLLVNEAELVLGGYPSATLSSDVSLPFNR